MRISEIVKKKEDEKKASPDQDSAVTESSVDIWNQGWDDNWKEKLKSVNVPIDSAEEKKQSPSETESDDPIEEDVSVFDTSGKKDKLPESFEEIGSEDFGEPPESKSFLENIIRPWRQDDESKSISIFAKFKSSVANTFKIAPRKKEADDRKSGPAIVNWLRSKKKKSPSEANQVEEKLITDISSELIPERQPQDIDSNEFNDIENLLAASMGPDEDNAIEDAAKSAEDAASQAAKDPETDAPASTQAPEAAETPEALLPSDTAKAASDSDASDSSVIGYVDDSDGPSEVKEPESQAPEKQDHAAAGSSDPEDPADSDGARKDESGSMDQSLENVDELVDFINESRKGQNLMDPDAIFEDDAVKQQKTLKGKIIRLVRNLRQGIHYATHPTELLKKFGCTWKDAAGWTAIIIVLIDILILLKKHLEN